MEFQSLKQLDAVSILIQDLTTRPAFTCSKCSIKTQRKCGVKYVQN